MSANVTVSITHRLGRGVWLETSLADDDPYLTALTTELWHGHATACPTCKADVDGRTVWHADTEHD